MRYLLAILTLVSFSVKSQLTLEVVKNNAVLIPVNFTVNSIIESFQTRRIGKVFLLNREIKETVILNKSAGTYFKELASKTISANQKYDSINLIIDYLDITEKKLGEIIEGKITLSLSYENQRYFGEVFLLEKTTSALYKRTFGSSTKGHFEQLIASAFRENINYFVAWKNLNYSFHPAFIKSSEVTIKPFYNKNVNDTIYHNSRPISWADFKGELPLSQYGASIFTNIAFDLEMSIQNQVLKAFFTPKVYMVQGMSWVKSSTKNEYSLEHERLHFDITRVAMNRYIKRVQQLNEFTPDDLQSRIQYEYLEAYREMNRLQKQYDEETGNGTDESAQLFWQIQVQKWLQE